MHVCLMGTWHHGQRRRADLRQILDITGSEINPLRLLWAANRGWGWKIPHYAPPIMFPWKINQTSSVFCRKGFLCEMWSQLYGWKEKWHERRCFGFLNSPCVHVCSILLLLLKFTFAVQITKAATSKRVLHCGDDLLHHDLGFKSDSVWFYPVSSAISWSASAADDSTSALLTLPGPDRPLVEPGLTFSPLQNTNTHARTHIL